MLISFSSVFLFIIYNTYRLIIFIVVLFALCRINAQANILVSIRPLGFIVSAIADGVVPVEVILPDSASPHDYTMRPTDVSRLKKSDFLVWVGPEFESFLSSYAFSMPANRLITIANLSRVIPLLHKNNNKLNKNDSYYFKHDCNYCHNHGRYNMHLWLSPTIAGIIAEAVYGFLVNLIPEKKEVLNNNLRSFKDRLIKNDKNIIKILSPVLTKKYYVFHDAYSYFEKYYGLKPLGYFTINPAIYPGPRILYKIKTELIKQQVTCIFSEPQFKPAIINTVSRGTNVHIGILDPLGIGISLNKSSYEAFLVQLSTQYAKCLEKNI